MSVGSFLHRLFGCSPFPERGVVQLSAVTLEREALHVLKIQQDAPRSQIDFFLLQSARAWADVIVTSGAIFRAEPELRYAFQGNADEVDSLRRWRRDGGRPSKPTLAILTSGSSFPDEHLALDDVRPLFYSSPEGRALLRHMEPGVEIVADTEPSPRRLLATLRNRGLERILIELGPASSRPLLLPSVLVDTLFLSRFGGREAEQQQPPWLGGMLLDEQELGDGFERCSTRRVSERSGRWCFELWHARTRTQ